MASRAQRFLAAQAILLSAAVLASRAVAAPPDVLEQVPDNAAVAVVVSDLRGVSNKVANLLTRMHLPANDDLLGLLQKQMGLQKGLDENGAMALVVMMPNQDPDAAPPTGSQEPFVLLVPTTDAKLLLEPFNPTASADGISTVTLPTPGAQDGFVATLGKYVAIAPSKDVLKAFMTHKGALAAKLSPEAQAAFEKNDLVAYVNFPTFAKQANQGLDQMAGFMAMMMQRQGNNANPLNSAMSQEALTAMVSGLHHILTDTQVGLLAAHLDDQGVTLHFSGHFAADSPTAKFVAAQKPATAPELSGFSSGNILMAGALSWDRPTMMGIVTSFMDNVANNPELSKEQSADATKMMSIQKQMIGMMDGVKMVAYEPSDPTKGILTNAVGVITVTDAAQFSELVKQASTNQALMASAASVPGLKTSVTTTPNATTVDGIALTKVTVKMERDDTVANGPAPQLAQVEQMLKTMYGGTTFASYYGTLDATHIVQIMTPDEAFLQKAVAAAKRGDKGLATELSTAHVVADPFAVAYLPMDRWVGIGLKLARAMQGEAAAATEPAGAAVGGAPGPLVVSLGASATAGSAQLFLPTALLVSMSDQAQAAQRQSMQPPPAPAQP